MDNRSKSKLALLNSINQLIGVSEDFTLGADGQKMNFHLREHSKVVYDLIEGGYFTGVLAEALADLLNDLSEIFEKGAVSGDKSEQGGGVNNGSKQNRCL